MKRAFVIFVALFTVAAITVPAFALEVKYGGLFRTRWVSNDNITDGNDDLDDNQNYFDQRLRMFFNFISSENLRLVVGFEQDTLWGDNRDSKIRNQHRDTIGLELKHAYVDFAIPNTTVRAKVGLQPVAFLSGWILDEDFTGIITTAKFDPITVTAGYIGERNGATNAAGTTFGVTTETENVDDFALAVNYASGPISATLVGLFQDGHDLLNVTGGVGAPLPIAPFGNNDNLFDLGLTFSYKQDFWNATFNFVKNLGSTDLPTGVPGVTREADYTGWMIEGIGNYFCGPWSFTLGAFYTSGDEDLAIEDDIEFFVYPVGNDHHWAEILGAGSLDAAIGGAGVADGVSPGVTGAYTANVRPSNLWTINVGASYQVLEGTKLTLNYYFAATAEDIVSGSRTLANGTVVQEQDSTIGHELDFYLDQKIVDKLMLRLVGAYLFTDDAYTIFNDDDDAYEVGAVLSWSF